RDLMRVARPFDRSAARQGFDVPSRQPSRFQEIDVTSPRPKRSADQAGIPYRVKISGFGGLLSGIDKEGHVEAGAADKLLDRVQRLMEVADEMDEVLQGIATTVDRGGPITQRLGGAIDGVDDAVPARRVRTIAHRIVIRLIERNADEMPIV